MAWGPRRDKRGRLAVLLLAAVVAGSAACGSDGESPTGTAAEGQGDAAASSTSAGTAGDASGAGGNAPCDVISPGDLDALVGDPVGSGEARTAAVTENGVEWTAAQCEWLSDAGTEIRLQLTPASGFASGTVECPEVVGVGAEVSALPALGDRASWQWDAVDHSGLLRACTDTVMADVEVGDDASDEATLQAIAIGVAAAALTSPGAVG